MRVLVLGRAKTGTTLVAKIIHASLPEHRLWFEPRSLKHFVGGESRNAVTKVIYDHWSAKPNSLLALASNELEYKFEKRIAIVRDPRDELISRMYYMARGAIMDRDVSRANIERWIDILRQKEADSKSLSVAQLLAHMNELLASNMQFNGGDAFDYFDFVSRHFAAHHVLRYEEFLAGERQAFADYLGISLVRMVADDDLISRTRRTAAYGNWKSLFLPSDIEAYMAQHGEAMAAMGYVDSELALVGRIDRSHGSEYVARLARTAYEDKRQMRAWFARAGQVA